MICTDCTSYFWMLIWRWSNKTETCCNNKTQYLYTCFDGNFKHFVLLLELKYNGTSWIEISYLSSGLRSSFFTSRFLIPWCIFIHASCPAYLIFLKYFVENRLFSSSLCNFLETSDTCSLVVALFSSELCSILSSILTWNVFFNTCLLMGQLGDSKYKLNSSKSSLKFNAIFIYS